MADEVIELPEEIVPGKRLGRNVWHDERSRAFSAARATTLRTVTHTRYIPPLNQGNLGSCTGNAAVGLIATLPFYRKLPVGIRKPQLNQEMSVSVYTAATKIDPFPGEMPSEDTGSNGLATMKVLRTRGLISGYFHCFGLQHTLETLVLQPVSIGIPWYDSFDSPTVDGFLPLPVGAQERGGHQMMLTGINVEQKYVYGYNSWGVEWNPILKGRFKMRWAVLDVCLKNYGDVITARI